MRQSTRHLLMVEPAVFYANPETMATNAYQVDGEIEPHDVILGNALAEFRAFRDMLVSNGVMITTVLGLEECPDMVFPNWASTHAGGRLILYPMLNENRQAERAPYIIDMLKGYYPDVTDWTDVEAEGLCLESTASIVSDHVNKRAYSGLSARTSPMMVERWAAHTGYDVMTFETLSHKGIPVYHTDFLMYIGTCMAGVCAECITDADLRKAVVTRLAETHEVIEFTAAQLQANCCNALEVVGADDERMLTMSRAAFEALEAAQLSVLRNHYNRVLTPDLATLEKYGGGSARCMLMEMF